MKTKNKKILAGTAALCLIAAVAAGGTLAYLTDETEQRANNFTFASNGIDAMLTEPEWDGVVDYEYDDAGNITPIYDWTDDDNDPNTPDVPVYGYEGGDIQKPVTDKTQIDDTTDRPRKDSTDPTFKPTYGDEQAQNMIPGQVATKNPIITNTGALTDEWVAAKVTFVYGEGSANAGKALNNTDWEVVKEYIQVDFNTTVSADGYWECVAGSDTVSQTYYYSDILAKGSETDGNITYGEVTKPIFNTVTLSTSADNEAIDKLNQMGGIAIYIEGYAVQSDAYADFNEWKVSGSAVFEHTPTTAAATDTGVAAPGIFPKG